MSVWTACSAQDTEAAGCLGAVDDGALLAETRRPRGGVEARTADQPSSIKS